MFQTSSAAEMEVPTPWAQLGERAWRYVELGLNIPYFLMTVRFVESGSTFRRHFMFSQLSDVLGLASELRDPHSIDCLQLLIPDFMHNGAGYDMGRIKQVWVDKSKRRNQTFVMADGRELRHAMDGSQLTEERELVFAA
jgi:hypothetical protein